MMQDFRVIRDIVSEDIVYIYPPGTDKPWSEDRHRYGGAPWALSYFLAGSVLIDDIRFGVDRNLANFILDRRHQPGPALLTPDNRHIFLYHRALYDRQYEATALGSPIIASDWNVYIKDDRRLIYTSEECAYTDAWIFLHIDLRDADDLPEQRKQYGFDNLDFRIVPNLSLIHI